ncbi:BON1-associated protein 2 [Raphanus sativus]|uniref:BON1-associated protein 2 n=1 Tax=Raphanus sativus TaxID=3726 RepID=A0A6J0NAQ5_RAPSA|nr:BON1-associated protein 2 [Raphanus sativus]KAJ4904304.1 BON1-associated protein 2 [Raphanus sativus]
MSYSRSIRSLEIELISAEGLKVNRKPVKRKTFGVVRIDQEIYTCTPDEQGGSYPIWKDRIKTEMATDGSVRFITIEVCYKTSGGAYKNVGVAKIPVTDFMGGFAPQGHLNFLSYRLRDEYGDKSGIINVSIMVKPDVNDVKYASPSPLMVPSLGYTACSSQAAAAANGQMWSRPRTSSSMAMNVGYGGRVVTGFPVNWRAYQRPT